MPRSACPRRRACWSALPRPTPSTPPFRAFSPRCISNAATVRRRAPRCVKPSGSTPVGRVSTTTSTACNASSFQRFDATCASRAHRRASALDEPMRAPPSSRCSTSAATASTTSSWETAALCCVSRNHNPKRGRSGKPFHGWRVVSSPCKPACSMRIECPTSSSSLRRARVWRVAAQSSKRGWYAAEPTGISPNPSASSTTTCAMQKRWTSTPTETPIWCSRPPSPPECACGATTVADASNPTLQSKDSLKRPRHGR